MGHPTQTERESRWEQEGRMAMARVFLLQSLVKVTNLFNNKLGLRFSMFSKHHLGPLLYMIMSFLSTSLWSGVTPLRLPGLTGKA